MRQTSDAGLPRLGQKTPDACGGTEMNIAPMAFSLNQNSVVCLPLVSDSQRFIWVHSDQINLQLDGAAELDKVFDRFPYLTQKQTAALALRCSLHPDQVKVWFMAQRLRYGISWDHKDIQKVKRKLKLNQQKEEPQNRTGDGVKADRGESKKWKREVKESGGKKAGEVREEQSANEGRMMGENARANERLEGKMKHKRLTKKEKHRKVEEDKRRKRKWMTMTDKTGKKRMKQGDEGVVERAGEAEIRSDEVEREWQKYTQSETTLCTRKKKKASKRLLPVREWPAHKSGDVPPFTDNQTEPVDVVPPSTSNIHMTPVKSGFEGARLEGELHAESTNSSGPPTPVTDVGKLRELMGVNDNPVVADGSPTFTQQQDSHAADACTLPTRIHYRTKTRTQLAMMKVAFSHCQYPDSDDYNQLETVIGLPRYMLVQWFSDMRYLVKKGRPRWLNQEQHSQVLANIKYRQCLNARGKLQQDGRKADWKMKLCWSGSYGKDMKMQVPPE